MSSFDDRRGGQPSKGKLKEIAELVVHVHSAKWDPTGKSVRLHAEAKVEFADGTTGTGVTVGFFLNGHRIGEGTSDDYGLASLNDAAPLWALREGQNELVVRVKGFPDEALDTFTAPSIPAENVPKPRDVVSSQTQRAALPKVPTVTNSIGMTFVPIQPGQFLIGDSEPVEHLVTLTRPFHMGAFQVTQAEFETVMGVNPSYYSPSGGGVAAAPNDTRRLPVEQVMWDEACEFCSRLSSLNAEKQAGRQYRLPTEAEWEYACRAGTTSVFSFGDYEDEFANFGWCRSNSGGRTHEVGAKKPNPWGLYDMHGNVWEWCVDWYYDNYPDTHQKDPRGPTRGSERVIRGGAMDDFPSNCASRKRLRLPPVNCPPTVGFRVVLLTA